MSVDLQRRIISFEDAKTNFLEVIEETNKRKKRKRERRKRTRTAAETIKPSEIRESQWKQFKNKDGCLDILISSKR